MKVKSERFLNDRPKITTTTTTTTTTKAPHKALVPSVESSKSVRKKGRRRSAKLTDALSLAY